MLYVDSFSSFRCFPSASVVISEVPWVLIALVSSWMGSQSRDSEPAFTRNASTRVWGEVGLSLHS